MLKVSIWLLFVAALPFSAGAVKAEVESATYPLQRYESLFVKSPFVKETPFASLQGPKPGEDLVITGHFQIADVIYLHVLNKKTQERMTLNSVDTASGHSKVVSLNGHDDPYKVTAIVQLGSETVSIGFERPAPPKLAASSAPGTPPGDQAASQKGRPESTQAKAASTPNPLKKQVHIIREKTP